jgi:hypothetical protein
VRRFALIAAVVAGAVVAGALVPATPASAHGGDAPDASDYRVAVTAVGLPGVHVTVVEAGARLELRNDTGHNVEILGYSGEPYLEIRDDGTYENQASPTAYANRTSTFDTALPAGADPTAPPAWRRVSTERTVRWHDERTRWLGDGLPPQARADPDSSHRLRDWTVPLRAGTTTAEIRGTLDWLPPPATWLWWVGAALLAVALTAAGLRFSRPAAAIALITGAIVISYATTRALDVTLLAVGALSVAAGIRPRSFLQALAGAAVLIFAGIGQADVFSQAIVAASGPAWCARVAVLWAFAGGISQLSTGLWRLRNDARTAAMVEA